MKRVAVLVRIAAAAIDFVAALVLLVVSAIVAAITGNDALTELIFLVVWFLYSGMEVVFAGTPGKLLLGLRIARPNGRDAERSRLFLRWSTKYYWLLPAIFNYFVPGTVVYITAGYVDTFIVCGLLGAFNDDRLTWHDEWSGTAVWKRVSPPPIQVNDWGAQNNSLPVS